jgi:hypothetical protein
MKSGWMSLARHATAIAVLAAASNAGAQVRTGGTSDGSQFRDQAAAVDLARKQALIAEVLSARETASGRKFSPALRGSLADKMSSVPTASLEAFANAGGLGNMGALVPNALGDAAADLVFTPVTPCRIVNTVTTATPLAANVVRNFYVNGNTAAVFEAQGGKAGGCGIPDSATAVEMNFVVAGPSGAGDLKAYPFAATPPTSSVINYAALPGLNIANGIAMPVCDASTTTCSFDLAVVAEVSGGHLIIDVVGYYRAPVGLSSARRAEFAFVPVLGTDVAANLAAVTFTPSRTGNALVTATGYCNIDQTGSEHGIGIGLAAAPASGTVSRTAYMRVQAAAAAGLHQFAWAITDYQAVTSGVAATVTLHAQQFFGTAGQNEDCSGTLLVSEVFSAS